MHHVVYLAGNNLTLPYLTLPYLTLPYLTLPYLTLPTVLTRHARECECAYYLDKYRKAGVRYTIELFIRVCVCVCVFVCVCVYTSDANMPGMQSDKNACLVSP